MLAKITSKNQLTLPKQVLEAIGRPDYLEVAVEDGRLILTPARIGAADEVRRKLAALDLSDADIVDAVDWARRRE